MKNKLRIIFKYIASRLSVLTELVILQKEMNGIMRNIYLAQNRIENKLNLLTGKDVVDGCRNLLLTRTIEHFLKTTLELNIRSYISGLKITENFSNSYDLILECLDGNESVVYVMILVYADLTDSDVQQNIENLSLIPNLAPGSTKLLFITRSANEQAKKISSSLGAYIMYSDKYFPRNPGLN